MSQAVVREEVHSKYSPGSQCTSGHATPLVHGMGIAVAAVI